jgi:hypothetical protein
VNAVYARLTGGVGNQMFQYAAARRLAFIHDAQLQLDLREFQNRQRHYALDGFCIRGQPASAQRLRQLNCMMRWPSRLLTREVVKRYKERSFRFDPEVLELKPPVYLDGYWQSERYFDDVRSEITSEFSFASDPSPRIAEMVEGMRAGAAVAVHVRRTDFVERAIVRQKHGSCSIDYYRAALLFVRSVEPLVRVFVFSDDMEWARRNLAELDPVTFVEGNTVHDDLRLMSSCKHNVIANSTFSWWAAWLNRSPDKIVVAPTPWFADGPSDSDLIPHTWVRRPR